MEPTGKQIARIGVALVALIAAAAAVFRYSEHISFLDGLYRAVYVVLAHHDNFASHAPASRATVIVLILASLLIIAYLLKWLAEYMMGLGDGLRRHQIKAKVSKMHNHYIVCGLGQFGAAKPLDWRRLVRDGRGSRDDLPGRQ